MDSLRKCKSRCLWRAPVVFFLAKTEGRICSGTTLLKSDELHQAETGTFFFSSFLLLLLLPLFLFHFILIYFF